MAINNIDQFVSSRLEVYFVQSGENRGGSAYYGCTNLFTQPSLTNTTTSQLILGGVGLAGIAISDRHTGTITLNYTSTGTTKYYVGFDGSNRRNQLYLSDLLWANSGVTAAGTSFTIDSVPFAARDADGTASGRGVRIALCPNVYAGSANFGTGAYISYTNSTGIANRTGYITHVRTGFSMTYDVMLPFSYQIGDVGVKSIQSLNIPSTPGLGCSLIAYREIAPIPGTSNDVSSTASTTLANHGLPIIYSGSSLFFTNYGVSQNTQVEGILKFIDG